MSDRRNRVKFLEAFFAVVVALAMMAFGAFVVGLAIFRVCLGPIIAICLIILACCAVYSLMG